MSTPSPRPPWPMLAALGVPVLLGHVLVLDAFLGWMQPPSQLTEMAEPLYTRVLLPQEVYAPTPPPLAPPAAPTPAPPSASWIEAHAKAQDAPAPHPLSVASQAQGKPPQPKTQRKPEPAEPTELEPSTQTESGHPNPLDSSAAQASSPSDAASSAEAASTTASHEAAADTGPTLSSNPSMPADVAAADSAQSAASASQAPGSSAAPALAGNSAEDSAGWLPDTRLNYRLGGNYRGELHGKARVSWQKNAGNYQAQVDLDIGFLVSMKLTSQGQFTQHHLVPQVYEEQVRKTRRRITLSENTVQLNNGNRLPRPAQVQDTASQFIELSHRFASGQQPLQVGQQVHFELARPNRMAKWTYEVVEETLVQLPTLGPTKAFLVRPRPTDGDSKGIAAQMWLAPSLNHLPVRILLSVADDKQVDLLLERIDQAAP